MDRITRQDRIWNPQDKRKNGRPKNTWRWELNIDVKTMKNTWQQMESPGKVAWKSWLAAHVPEKTTHINEWMSGWNTRIIWTSILGLSILGFELDNHEFPLYVLTRHHEVTNYCKTKWWKTYSFARRHSPVTTPYYAKRTNSNSWMEFDILFGNKTCECSWVSNNILTTILRKTGGTARYLMLAPIRRLYRELFFTLMFQSMSWWYWSTSMGLFSSKQLEQKRNHMVFREPSLHGYLYSFNSRIWCLQIQSMYWKIGV